MPRESAPPLSGCDRLLSRPSEFVSICRDGPPHGERLASLSDIVNPQDLNTLLNRGERGGE